MEIYLKWMGKLFSIFIRFEVGDEPKLGFAMIFGVAIFCPKMWIHLLHEIEMLLWENIWISLMVVSLWKPLLIQDRELGFLVCFYDDLDFTKVCPEWGDYLI